MAHHVSSVGVGLVAARLDCAAPLIRFRHLPCTPLTNNRRYLNRTALASATTMSGTGGETGSVKVHPSLEVSGGGCHKYLPALENRLERGYQPFPILGWNCHVETIFAALLRSVPEVRYRRECIRTKDNGTVALDWVAGDGSQLPPVSPVLILLPGLTGGSQDTYVRHMLMRARKQGWRVVVFNSRGCGNSPVTTPKFYSSSFTGDLTEVVAHVSAIYPNANLYAIGWSIGANILTRYLGHEPQNCTLAGAVALCNPFNMPIANEDLQKGFNSTYDKSLANALCKIFNKHATLFEDIGGEYNIPMAANAKTIKQFDEALTRVSFGFKSADDYYSQSSSSDVIKYVSIPYLCIQAANDPIAPARAIPHKDIEANENCILIVTPKGGHLGWVAGDGAPFGCPWTDPFVMDFLEHLEKRSAEASSSSRQLNDMQPYTEPTEV